MDDNKKRALAAALGQIERQFGKGAVMRMGDQERQGIPAISTGSLGLDIALGIGGRNVSRMLLKNPLIRRRWSSVVGDGRCLGQVNLRSQRFRVVFINESPGHADKVCVAEPKGAIGNGRAGR